MIWAIVTKFAARQTILPLVIQINCDFLTDSDNMESPLDKRLYGLIGHPLTHSFSRDFFNQKFQDEGINAQYVNFDITDIDQLTGIIADNPMLDGLNVTAPYKEAVIPLLDDLDESARVVGAVNVIRFMRDADTGVLTGLRGYNTDVTAFGATLPSTLEAGDRAMVLGTGGAAKAVGAALASRGIAVQPVSRRKAADILVPEEITRAMVTSCRLVVNATPVGMYPEVDRCPDFPYRFLTAHHLCYDLIYNPEETLFLKHAASQGAQTMNGIEMLLLQAIEAYDIWTQPATT